MTDLLNPTLAVISIAFGLIGWLAPRYTMAVIDLLPGPTAMGISEVRAASGALFVGMGAGALLMAVPAGYAMIGFCWGGAAVGRMTSILLDGPTRRKWGFLATEAAVAALALGVNLPA